MFLFRAITLCVDLQGPCLKRYAYVYPEKNGIVSKSAAASLHLVENQGYETKRAKRRVSRFYVRLKMRNLAKPSVKNTPPPKKRGYPPNKTHPRQTPAAWGSCHVCIIPSSKRLNRSPCPVASQKCKRDLKTFRGANRNIDLGKGENNWNRNKKKKNTNLTRPSQTPCLSP